MGPDCDKDSSCSPGTSCISGTCVDPCLVSNPCPKTSRCSVEDHKPICSCSPGETGDPYTQCSHSELFRIISLAMKRYFRYYISLS